jgi:WhiB family redox-sensing transcriptional regulator
MSQVLFAVSEDDWRQHGNCRGLDVANFYPDLYDATSIPQMAHVLAVCDGCKVLMDCLEYAIDNEALGVWGGSTPRERDRIRRRRLFQLVAS